MLNHIEYIGYMIYPYPIYPIVWPRLQLASMLEFQFSAPQGPEEGAYEGSSEWLDSEAVQQWLQTAGLRVSQ